MWIENISAADCAKGHHHDCGGNSMLIQISDPSTPDTKLFTTPWFPAPHYQFKEVHQFQFLDADDRSSETIQKYCITDAQAAELVRLLKHALDNHMNVVVHCFAGICRSGAVCEVGTIMGFNEVHNNRIPNLLVKRKMMQVLGLTYTDKEPDPQTTSFPEWL